MPYNRWHDRKDKNQSNYFQFMDLDRSGVFSLNLCHEFFNTIRYNQAFLPSGKIQLASFAQTNQALSAWSPRDAMRTSEK